MYTGILNNGFATFGVFKRKPSGLSFVGGNSGNGNVKTTHDIGGGGGAEKAGIMMIDG